MNQQEVQALLDLIHLDGRVDDLAAAARSASGGRIDEVAHLSPERAIGVLDKFLSGSVSARELTEWAEVVHSLDTIGVTEEHEDLLIQLLFEISTPELFYEISAETCSRWIARLRQAIS
ncbi:hypothetical protein SBI_05302 [Streptomyces bingchenggensis BCW-1]|uniref:Uncharacterized protein n=1 Tax=Streptomyces bingchenggensis (strain BCW-1) TaxID=749414 RepID=D7C735_STRBB|nr:MULTISPECIES: hypothetical protein [Streptomyces]ADI08422.1 hypothetical protein SBI_05302 [Streptomyces bingchenggensis BCW-1]